MKFTTNQLKALDLNRNLAVTAGAGSGKTTVLVHRYVHILKKNPALNIRNILAITFTEKASAEMKERIFETLNNEFRENSHQRERMFQLLNHLHEAQIFTIHAFCSHLLRQFPVESGLGPDFNVLDGTRIDALLNQTFRDFFLNYQTGHSPESAFIMEAVREFSVTRLKEIFLEAYRSRSILHQFLDVLRHAQPAQLVTQWKELFLDYHKQILKPLLNSRNFRDELSSLLQLGISGDEKEMARMHDMQANFAQLQSADSSEMERINALIRLIGLLTKNDGSAYIRMPIKKAVLGEEGTAIFASLSEQAAGFSSGLIPFVEDGEKRFSEIYLGLGLILLQFMERVEQEKARQNAVDFDDLQLAALKILQKSHIRDQVRQRYPFILVDEFQDTDVLQSGIIRLLSTGELGELDPHRLFLVGDPKQSIFGFRNADVSIFQEFIDFIGSQDRREFPFTVPETGEALSATPENLAGIIRLSQNYRSAPDLIHFFNRTFEPIFSIDSEYDVPFQPLEVARPDPRGDRTNIQLDIFHEEEEQDVEGEKLQAQRISSLIHKIVGQESVKKLVGKGADAHLENLDFGDCAVLIRSRRNLEVLEFTFRENGIPYQTYKGAGFFEKQEIQDLYYILRSLADPDDDFAMLAFLRSNYVGLSDVCLFYLSQAKGATYVSRLQHLNEVINHSAPPEKNFRQEFYEFMQKNGLGLQLHDGEKRSLEFIVQKHGEWSGQALLRHYGRLLDDIIENLQIRALLLAQPDGEQKVANLDKFIHYVFEFEQENSGVLADLLDTIQLQMSGQAQEGEAVIMAEDENKVKILTFHSAKGMEFPAVFLPFLERPFKYDSKMFTDKKRGFAFKPERTSAADKPNPFIYEFMKQNNRQKIVAEEKRLFYVAATRARDHLFLSGAVDKKGRVATPGYLSWLMAVYDLPMENPQDQPELVWEEGSVHFTMCRHFPEQEPDSAPTGQPAIDEKIPENIIEPDNIKYQVPVPEKPGGQFYSVTQLMLFKENPDRYFHHFYMNDGDIIPPRVEPEFIDEPGGALWGSIVHKMLEDIHLRPAENDSQKIEQLIFRFGLHGQPEADVIKRRLQDTIQAVRKSGLIPSGSPKTQFSEFQVEMRINEFVLRGIFDNLYLNSDGEWEILDFKTNRIKAEEINSTAKKYVFQVEAYGLLLSRLYPQQNRFPVTLFFLEPMQTVKKIVEASQLPAIQADIYQLMRSVLEKETEMFYR